jgi:hypothetical protein
MSLPLSDSPVSPNETMASKHKLRSEKCDTPGIASNFDKDERIRGGGELGGSFARKGPHAAGSHEY